MIDVFKENAELEEDTNIISMMKTVDDNLKVYNSGNYLMTDDKAPVELLGMRVIDEIIRDEVKYYKDIYEEGGLNALLDVLK